MPSPQRVLHVAVQEQLRHRIQRHAVERSVGVVRAQHRRRRAVADDAVQDGVHAHHLNGHGGLMADKMGFTRYSTKFTLSLCGGQGGKGSTFRGKGLGSEKQADARAGVKDGRRRRVSFEVPDLDTVKEVVADVRGTHFFKHFNICFV